MQTDRDRQLGRQRQLDRDRQLDRLADRQAGKQTESRQAWTQTDRQATDRNG